MCRANDCTHVNSYGRAFHGESHCDTDHGGTHNDTNTVPDVSSLSVGTARVHLTVDVLRGRSCSRTASVWFDSVNAVRAALKTSL